MYARENLDIINYIHKYGVLFFEIAERLELDVEQFDLYLSEPLTNKEKAEIASIVRKVFDIQYLKRKYSRTVDSNYAHSNDKYVHAFTKHCCLNDGPKYTGQNKNYYEGKWGWD